MTSTELGPLTPDQSWAPEDCTLPTAERPLRRAEWDSLLDSGLRRQTRLSPTVLRWELDPATETAARDLAARETCCCSFFEFAFSDDDNAIRVDVTVPPQQSRVLDALQARARREPS